MPDYKVAGEVWREISQILKPVAVKSNATERRIELPNGGVIEVWTLENEDAGRGRKYKRVIVDEAAMAPYLEAAWERAISPTLIDMRGDAWFPSTPKGLNFYYNLFQRGLDPAKPDWKCWQLPSSVNPFLPPEEIEREREGKTELDFKQEYLAEFISSDGAVFRNVDACLVAPVTTPETHAGHVKVAGVDLAQKHDFTAVSGYCVNCESEIFLDRWNKVGWESQRGRLLNLLIKWGVSYCLIELNSVGQPNFEALVDLAPSTLYLSGFETTAKTKPPLIRQLELAFERQDCAFLPDDVARMELLAYESTIMPSGYVRYSAPEGHHDDTVIARCLAYEARKRNPLPPPGRSEEISRRLSHFEKTDTELAEMSDDRKRGYWQRLMRDQHEIEEAYDRENKSDYQQWLEEGE